MGHDSVVISCTQTAPQHPPEPVIQSGPGMVAQVSRFMEWNVYAGSGAIPAS